MSSGGVCVGCGGPVPINENLCEVCLDDGSDVCIDCGKPGVDVLGRCSSCSSRSERDRLRNARDEATDGRADRYETDEDRTLKSLNQEDDWRDAHAWDGRDDE